MKKIILTTLALTVALISAAQDSEERPDYLVVHHSTESNLRAEIEAALKEKYQIESETPTEADYKEAARNVTELKIISDFDVHDNPTRLHIYSYSGSEDCSAIRVYFRPSNNAASQLKKVDFSEAFFQDNATGTTGDQGDFLSYITCLEEVVLPESVVTLAGAFYACSNLTKVNLDNITAIGKGALAGCTKLVITEFPKGLKKIYANAFEHESNKSPKFEFPAGYELPETLESIGDAAFKGWDVAWTKLPTNLIEVGVEAFMNTKCTFSELPSGLKTIGKAAFRSAPVTFSYLPESVESVGYDAFIMCPTITDFTLSGIFETEVPDRVFYLGAPYTVDRTFRCRAANPPTVALAQEGTSQGSNKAVTGSFGPDKSYSRMTFVCLYDYKDNYNKAPWNTNLKYYTTNVSIDAPEHVTVSHPHHGDVSGTMEIYEGSHEWSIIPETGYYITSIRYEEAGAPEQVSRLLAEEEETTEPGYDNDGGEGEEPTEPEEPEVDPAQLYTINPDEIPTSAPVGVTVPVTSKAGTLKVETEQLTPTGIESVEAPSTLTRRGSIITAGEGTATLYDLTGKAITTSAEIDLNKLTPGVYIVRAGEATMKVIR